MTHFNMHGAWMRLIFIINMVIIVLLAVCLFTFMLLRFQLNPILVGMALQYIQEMFNRLLGIMFCIGGYQRQTVKIQQCLNMLNIPQENDIVEKDEWPREGQITFDDVKLKYRPNTELVLKGLSFEVQGGKKVGIVGRTGAGKSTLSLALTRIIELTSGTIRIDDTDISQVPINKLRDKITIIPQDPTLFKGSLRMNIDPDNRNSDEEIIKLLKKAGLDSVV